MHFQLWLPPGSDLKQIAPDLVLTGEQYNDSPGPEGTGKLVWWPPLAGPPKFGYRPDEQDWRPAVKTETHAAGAYWIGFWQHSPPKPAELERPHTFEVSPVKLGDGQVWHIPAAARLPKKVGFTPDGKNTWTIKDQFRQFWEESVGFYRQFMTVDPANSELRIDGDWIAYILRAMRLCYRMTPEVLDQLELDRKSVV